MAEQQAFQFAEGGSIPTSPLQLTFTTVKAKFACELNAHWHSRFPMIHWSNVVRNRHYVCYVAWFESEPYAVAIWSTPIASNRLKYGLQMLELRRMAIAPNAPKNTASRMISWMRKDIEKRFQDIIRLISYQDVEAHHGTIYKASGWRPVESQYKFTDWNHSGRKRNAPQSNAPKIRWEFDIREPQEERQSNV